MSVFGNSPGRDLQLRSHSPNQLEMVWGEDGNPVFDDTETYAVNAAIDAMVGKWFADKTGRYGSDLHNVVFDQGASTASKIETSIIAALQPLVPNRIVINQLKISNFGDGKYRIALTWSSRNNRQTTIIKLLEIN